MEKKPNLVRTRFAPSPTGALHIGGARTVLFNYLFAKKNSGQFVFRIEDTDIARNQEAFVKSQHEDLKWLGLNPDESIFQLGNYGPYRQTERLEIYRNYINKLIQEKKAYYCFCSPEELAQEKEEYIKKNKRGNYQYSGKCLQLSEAEIQSFLHQQAPHVLRLKVPQEKNYSFHDLVRGKINFQSQDIEDFVLFRQNGIPNYNFACVIDDYCMKISHVLRGEEHLSNTGKQLVLYEALGWKPPLFGHISIILNKEKKKLSKRDKETSQWQLISQLRDKGYLPAAIVNYLLLLGWHPGTNQEIFSLSEAIKAFNLEGLNARGAVYELEKLNWYNNYYIQQLTEERFAEYAWQFLGEKYKSKTSEELRELILENEFSFFRWVVVQNFILKKIFSEIEGKEWVKQISLLFRPQLNYLAELIDLTHYFFHKPDKEFEMKKNEILWSEQLRKELSKLDKWEVENIKSVLKSVCLNNQAPKKEFYLLVRSVLTGTDKGPELPKIIYLLNKKEVEKRFKIIFC